MSFLSIIRWLTNMSKEEYLKSHLEEVNRYKKKLNKKDYA